jgi:transposase
MAMNANDIAAWVGIDWADQKHAVCLQARDASREECCEIEQSAEGLTAWVAELRKRFSGRAVAICLEQSRGALIYALMKYDFLALYPINPKQLACYREALNPSGAKDDPSDARLLMQFVRDYHEKLRRWQPDDEQTRRIGLLAEARRRLVEERTRLGNWLQSQLKQYFPLALELDVGHLHAEWFLKLLAKWPTLKALKRAAPNALARVLPGGKERMMERVRQIREAQPLVTDPALVDAGALLVASLVPQLQALNRAIAEYDRQLALAMHEHPDAELFQKLPGAGSALAPRLLAAFGSDRSRHASAAELQRYSGIAPVTKRSGKALSIKRRRACPKFLRQTFHEFADHSRKSSRWAMAYYRLQHEQRGKGHHASLRALAFKWIRVLFHCWQHRLHFDETRYLERLQKKNSPLLAHVPAAENG